MPATLPCPKIANTPPNSGATPSGVCARSAARYRTSACAVVRRIVPIALAVIAGTLFASGPRAVGCELSSSPRRRATQCLGRRNTNRWRHATGSPLSRGGRRVCEVVRLGNNVLDLHGLRSFARAARHAPISASKFARTCRLSSASSIVPASHARGGLAEDRAADREAPARPAAARVAEAGGQCVDARVEAQQHDAAAVRIALRDQRVDRPATAPATSAPASTIRERCRGCRGASATAAPCRPRAAGAWAE